MIQWTNFNINWINTHDKEEIYIVFYEGLKERPVETLEGILSFLNLTLSSQRKNCISNNLEGHFKRPERNYVNPFTKELRSIVYKAIENVDSALLAQLNLRLPVNLYKFYNQSEVDNYIH